VIQIEKNNYYEISYNEKKNRIFYKLTGYWPSCCHIPNYINHIDLALSYVKPGFTMLVDISLVEPHPPEIECIRKRAKLKAINKGLLSAAIVSSKSIVSSLQFDEMTKCTHFPKHQFNNVEDAEKFLENEVNKLCLASY
jgi:hypothetical protein